MFKPCNMILFSDSEDFSIFTYDHHGGVNIFSLLEAQTKTSNDMCLPAGGAESFYIWMVQGDSKGIFFSSFILRNVWR